jgi:hypothetical protein
MKKKFYDDGRIKNRPKLDWLDNARENYKKDKEGIEETERLINKGLIDKLVSDNHDLIFLGEYKKLFEQIINPTVNDYHDLYCWILDNYVINLMFNPLKDLIDRAFNDEGDEWEDFKKYLITYGEIIRSFLYETSKLKDVYDEFASKIGIDTEPIKEYPKNATEKEKEILKHLASNFHIQRELSPNGKLPLFGKNGTKRLIETLYKYAPDYKDYQAFSFINSNIETNLPIATLQNYCREVRKVTPDVKPQNV